jgi:predicted RNA-binding Zn ribbon-like protein
MARGVTRRDLTTARQVVDLADAVRKRPDLGRDELAALLARAGQSPESLTSSALTTADAARLRAAIGRLADVLRETDTDRAATALNDILAECGARPRLSRHDGSAWHLHVDRADDAGWDEWLLASGAHALAQILSEHGRPAWGVCHAHDCAAFYLAVGPGLERRYCSATCSSRARVAAHRQRKATTGHASN